MFGKCCSGKCYFRKIVNMVRLSSSCSGWRVEPLWNITAFHGWSFQSNHNDTFLGSDCRSSENVDRLNSFFSFGHFSMHSTRWHGIQQSNACWPNNEPHFVQMQMQKVSRIIKRISSAEVAVDRNQRGDCVETFNNQPLIIHQFVCAVPIGHSTGKPGPLIG